MGSRSDDQWKHYFENARGDIFDVIQNAIMIAASDYPEQFLSKRDDIAEKLFVCHLTNTKNNCNGICRTEEKVVSQVDSSVNENGNGNLNYSKDYSYHEAEALTAKNKEENQLVDEVLRIKELLFNSENQCEDVVIESLQKLQMMSLTMEILEETKIGKTVSALYKHKSKRVSNLARSLVREWKDVVELWLSGVRDIRGGEHSPDSVHPLGVQEGLPSPPLDEKAFLATQNAPIEFSKELEFCSRYAADSKDSPEVNSGDLNEKKLALQNQRIPMRTLSPHQSNIDSMGDKGEDARRNDSRNKQNKVSNTDVGLVKAPKSRYPVGDETKLEKKLNAVVAQAMPLPDQKNRVKFLNGDDQMKLEAAREKLHKGYQQAENAKKQRTIQVMELQELPKQCNGAGHPRPKSGKHNRNFSKGPR